MVKRPNVQEVQVKKAARHRLVGAITLAMLVIVFVPMVLDKDPSPPSQPLEIIIPEKPKELLMSIEKKNETVRPNKQEARESVKGFEDKALITSENKKNHEKKEIVRRYVVQLGAFKSRSTAKKLISELEVLRMPVYTEMTRDGGSERIRVRIGPFKSKGQAEAAVIQVEKLELKIGKPSILSTNRK